VEMRILILHGMIHLAGFDHATDQGEMDRLERRLRRRLGVAGRVPAPLGARRNRAPGSTLTLNVPVRPGRGAR
jgi:probable rRNA maturation factor